MIEYESKMHFVYYPDPLLRERAEPLDEPASENILSFIEKMKKICIKRDGVGLSAHQVGLVLPVLVAGIPKGNDGYDLVGVVNPRIIEESKLRVVKDEGCLSFPKLFFPVERPKYVIVEGWFDDIKCIARRNFSDMAARIFCHEIDHINGVLYIDRADAETRQRIKPDLLRIASEKRSGEIIFEPQE